jgi:hypothetical protein
MVMASVNLYPICLPRTLGPAEGLFVVERQAFVNPGQRE